MNKTLVVARHLGGPLQNGADGCYARWQDGFCSGNRAANWLNSLGDDNDQYGGGIRAIDGHIITNGEVRNNWLRDASSTHLQAVNGLEAGLLAQEQNLRRQLHEVRRKLKACRSAVKAVIA